MIDFAFFARVSKRGPKSSCERTERRISRKCDEHVFLRWELRVLGGEDHVLRVLRILVQEKQLEVQMQLQLPNPVVKQAEFSVPGFIVRARSLPDLRSDQVAT